MVPFAPVRGSTGGQYNYKDVYSTVEITKPSFVPKYSHYCKLMLTGRPN